MAAEKIIAGTADIVIAGGMENMSLAPYAVMQGRYGYRMNNGVLVDTMIKDALWDAFNDYHMIKTADNVAEQWGLTREELDVFAANSQNKACAAMEAGKFKDEIVPVEVKMKKQTVIVDTDEGPRPGTTPEGLAKLRTINAGGVTTAGNASGINDGAACVVVMSEEKAKELGVTPMATWVAGALGGVDPSIMGVGPVAATKKVLARTGLTSSRKRPRLRSFQTQCQRRRDRSRTPRRSFRMPYPCNSPSRDGQERCQEGPCYSVHRRRHGLRYHRRERLITL